MQSIAALPATAGAADATAPQPRLVRAAHEFEAQMMKELMKPMTQKSTLTGDEADSESDSGSGSALTEFASEALGRALSERGGFGMASQIVKELSHSGTRTTPPPVTGNPHTDTVMKEAG
jgi:Rod binding domain-containing protein